MQDHDDRIYGMGGTDEDIEEVKIKIIKQKESKKMKESELLITEKEELNNGK